MISGKNISMKTLRSLTDFVDDDFREVTKMEIIINRTVLRILLNEQELF